MRHANHAMRLLASIALAGALVSAATTAAGPAQRKARTTICSRCSGDWQKLEQPTLLEGAPDYTAAAIAKRQAGLAQYQARLAAIDDSAWPLEQKIDYELVRAQMNGLDFDIRVLRPWERDPAFYQSVRTEQSDTPAHEGPVHHALIELWQYTFPLSKPDAARLAAQLRTIPPLLSQARANLTGNAHDLWVTGTGTMQQQVADLADLAGEDVRVGPGTEAGDRVRVARHRRIRDLAPGPGSVEDRAVRYRQGGVQLGAAQRLPRADDLGRRGDAAQARTGSCARVAALRGATQSRPAAAVQRPRAPTNTRSAPTMPSRKYMAFLRKQDILGVEDYLEPAMRVHINPYSPPETRNFFAIASHYEPITLFAHFYHWFDHAWMEHKPNASPIRREALLYNVWDNRSEGMATAMEEIVLHAGYYDDNPRAREIVWIMLAQRCARGLASLYAQANLFDLQQAKAFQVEWTPRGWMRPDLDLLGFEQQLYLRQPGYGSSYVTGKYLIEQTIQQRSHQLGDAFTLRRFFDEFNAAGMMPVSLIDWQLTGHAPPFVNPARK